MQNKKNWLIMLFLIVVGSVPAAYWYFFKRESTVDNFPVIRFVSEEPKQMVPMAEFRVFACKVLDGGVFVVTLENQQTIEVRLKMIAKQEAYQEVAEVLKSAGSPTVVLLRKIGDYWVVDFNLTLQGKRTTMIEWLSSKGLLL